MTDKSMTPSVATRDMGVDGLRERDRLWDAILGELNLAYAQGAAGESSTNMEAADRIRALSTPHAEGPQLFGMAIIADHTLPPNSIAFISGGKRTVFQLDAAMLAASIPSED